MSFSTLVGSTLEGMSLLNSEPGLKSSKLDLASGCLSRYLGVKTISYNINRELKLSATI